MTLPEARRLVAVAVAAYPSMQEKELSMTASLWQGALADLPLPKVEKALLKIVMTHKFFPTISEIREATLLLSREDHPTPEEAWAEVMEQLDPYRAPAYSDPLVHRAVRAIGYVNLCMSEHIGVERSHFLQIYASFLRRAQDATVNESVEKIAGKCNELVLQVLGNRGRKS